MQRYIYFISKQDIQYKPVVPKGLIIERKYVKNIKIKPLADNYDKRFAFMIITSYIFLLMFQDISGLHKKTVFLHKNY